MQAQEFAARKGVNAMGGSGQRTCLALIEQVIIMIMIYGNITRSPLQEQAQRHFGQGRNQEYREEDAGSEALHPPVS